MVGNTVGQVPGPYEDTTCQMVAAYGKKHHPHLEVIRDFRDEVLKSNSLGRKLVKGYYATAPFFAPLTSWNRITQNLILYSFAYPSYLFSRASLRVFR